jgi:lysyl-tRNA synthetase, class I
MQVPIEGRNVEAGTIAWSDPDSGERFETPVTGGHAKAQWKPDWALRWAALGVDYEMSGKDHIDNVKTSSKICRVLGGMPPEGFNYELFLDENGEKISKSKGNGLTIDEWLEYGSDESLGFYLFRDPKSAKSLHVGIIPRAVDEYWQFREKLPEQPVEQQLGNPVWHLLRANGYAGGDGDKLPVTYGLLLNLVGVLGAGASRDQVWSYLGNYVENADAAAHPALDGLVTRALAYNRDFIAPTLIRRKPEANEALALAALDKALAVTADGATAEELQNIVYEIGKNADFAFETLRDWFKCLYETLLGSAQGPRMGSFVALYGVDNTRKLIAEALSD